MFNRLFSIFMLLFYTQSWALNCSSPETISDQRLNAYRAEISSNEKGDLFLAWISCQGNSKRIEFSHKTQNSFWSLSEPVSSWEEEIGFKTASPCFVNAKGNLFIIWAEKKENLLSLYSAEKIEQNPWNFYSNWISSDSLVIVHDFEFDSTGGSIFIGEKIIPYTPKADSRCFYKNTVPALAIFTTSPGQTEQKSDISPLDPSCNRISKLKIVINKKGIGYAFWCNHTHEDGNFVMCQKIVNGHFILEPEIVCPLQRNYIYELEAAINEKEDIIVAYCDDHCNGNVITKIKNSWSKPFLFTNKTGELWDDLYEEVWSINVAIDDFGNMMVVWDEESNEEDVIKTIYKPENQVWQKPILLDNNKSCWNSNVKPDGAGNFIAIWQQEYNEHNIIFGKAFSTATQTWSNLQRLSPQEKSCFEYTYTFWAPGKGYIAWIMSVNGDHEVIQVAELFH